ncbi:MAG: acyl-CoA mutase large subunit family protein [Candidatus Dormibacteria bacterium]
MSTHFFSTEADVPFPAPDPGSYPFTRGIRKDGYATKVWTMRQYAGFGTAAQTNERFHRLIDSGQTGLSMAFDLPTQMGYDSDDPIAHGEVGRVGVAIDSVEDMAIACTGLPLDQVTTSMTINAPAALLLLMYVEVAKDRGISPASLGGTIQNDILKEFVARGTYIFPPGPSMRLICDTFAYCEEHLPRWNPISVSGYHMREAGATAAQEIGFTLANAIAYAEALQERDLDLAQIIPRMTFFFNVSNDFLEEVAKFRAARTLWARIVRERFHLKGERAAMLRCHAQTSGATLTAQQPHNNIVRVAIQSLAAVLGGVQSLHSNSYDEALALPTEHAAEVALRTQQIIEAESKVTSEADPLGGSYYLEKRTQGLVDEAQAILERVDRAGGAISAIDQGLYQREIADAAYAWQQKVDSKTERVVGVNTFIDEEQEDVPILTISDDLEHAQIAQLHELRSRRNEHRVEASLLRIVEVAASSNNLLPALAEGVAARATLGEMCTALRTVFGSYEPPSVV